MNNTIENLKKLGVASLLATVPLTGLSSCDDDKTVVVDRTVFEPSSELLNLEGKVVEFEVGEGITVVRYVFQAGNEVLITDTKNELIQSGVYSYTVNGRDIQIGILERIPNQNADEAARLINDEIARQPNGVIATGVANIFERGFELEATEFDDVREALQTLLVPQGISFSFHPVLLREMRLIVGSNSLVLSLEGEAVAFDENGARKFTATDGSDLFDAETGIYNLVYTITENTIN